MRFLILCTWVLLPALGTAQDHSLSLRVENGIAGADAATVEVLHSNTTEHGLLGWEMAVCADIDPDTVELGPEVLFEGNPPEFVVNEIVPGQGWYAGVSSSVSSAPIALSPAIEVLHVSSFTSDSVGDFSTDFCSIALSEFNVISPLLVVDGTGSVEPATTGAVISFGELVVEEGFVRSDANLDGVLDVMDGIDLLNYMFLGAAPPSQCLDASDFTGDGEIRIGDAVGILQFMFLNSVFPAPPYPECGLPDTLFFPCEDSVCP